MTVPELIAALREARGPVHQTLDRPLTGEDAQMARAEARADARQDGGR